MNKNTRAANHGAIDSQPSTQNLVSIVIPAFNASRTLAQTLDSILDQTYRNIEIIVVNDGSTDATADVLKSYGDLVHSIHQPNGGLANARNTGCRSARGEYIALMDADDLCVPERIAIQVEVMGKLSDAVLCCSDFSAFNSHGPISISHGENYYSRIKNATDGLRSLYPEQFEIEIAGNAWPEGEQQQVVSAFYGAVYSEIVHGNFVHPPTVMFRRNVLHEIGMFDEKLPYTCDWECMVRAARLGPFAHINLPLLQYRLSDAQMSARRVNGEGALCVVRAATKIYRNDPELMVIDRRRMRESLGEFCRDAADELTEWNKMKALRLLVSSVQEYGQFKLATLKTALKIVAPTGLIRLTRKIYRRLKKPNLSSIAYTTWVALLAKMDDMNEAIDQFLEISEVIPI